MEKQQDYRQSLPHLQGLGKPAGACFAKAPKHAFIVAPSEAFMSFPPMFGLSAWDFASSRSCLSALLAQLGRQKITENYRQYGGAVLSRDLAQELLTDHEHFSGIISTWTTPSWLRLPPGEGPVVLEPSTPEMHWLHGEMVHGARVFERTSDGEMLVHMQSFAYDVWMVRSHSSQPMATLDVGFSRRYRQRVMRMTSCNKLLAIVGLSGEMIYSSDRNPQVEHAGKVARYLARVLPENGITFGVRIRCILSASHWQVLDLFPSPECVRNNARYF